MIYGLCSKRVSLPLAAEALEEFNRSQRPVVQDSISTKAECPLELAIADTQDQAP
jgi:hypothetical protein